MSIAEHPVSNLEDSCHASSHPAPRRGRFYLVSGKRVFDFIVSGAGLVLLSPLLLAVGLAAKLASRGPAFYRQKRVGKDAQPFFILKFRTMRMDAETTGPGITIAGDPRITPLGRILRFCKLDELPQLWNVFKGEMSLVGPRPELPCYVRNYTAKQRLVLSVRPGITDLASLAYRHEACVLARYSDPEPHYRQVVLPNKLELNLQYLSRASFAYDLALIFRTLWSIFFPTSEKFAGQPDGQSASPASEGRHIR